jgi:hypothetical protein
MLNLKTKSSKWHSTAILFGISPGIRFAWKDLLHFSPILFENVLATHAAPLLQLLTFISVITYLQLAHKLIN